MPRKGLFENQNFGYASLSVTSSGKDVRMAGNAVASVAVRFFPAKWTKGVDSPRTIITP